MIKRIGRAYLVEVAKALRRRFSALGLVIVLAVVVCLPLAKPISHGNPSAYAFVAYATPMALNLVGLLLLVLFASSLVASELGGSMWLALVRPIRRSDLLLAKMAVGMTYAFLMTACAATASWALAYALGDLNGVTYGGETLFTHANMTVCYLYGFLLVLLPEFAAIAYATFISACVRSSVSAMGLSVGLWLLFDAVKHPLRIAPYLFTSYLETPWEVFTRHCDGISASWWPVSAYAIAVCSAWIVVLGVLSVVIMARRDFRV